MVACLLEVYGHRLGLQATGVEAGEPTKNVGRAHADDTGVVRAHACGWGAGGWVVCVGCVCGGGGGGAGGGRAVRPLSCSLSHFVGSFRLFASQPLTSQYCSATGAAQRVVVDVGCEVGAGVGEVLAQGGLVPVTLQVRPGGA